MNEADATRPVDWAEFEAPPDSEAQADDAGSAAAEPTEWTAEDFGEPDATIELAAEAEIVDMQERAPDEPAWDGPTLAGLKLRWREFRAERYTGEEIKFGFWVVVDDLAALLRMMMEEEALGAERRMPYFGIVWPSAESLVARMINGPDIKGKQVLDLGCGLGMCGFAAAAMGARVTFFDWEPRAIEIIKATAEAQEWPDPRFGYVVGDWRQPPRLNSFDLILGADLLYEQSSPDAVAQFLAKHLKPGGEAWVTDPGRPQAWPFIGRALDHGLELVRRERLAPQRVAPDIALLRLRRPFFGAHSGIRGRI